MKVLFVTWDGPQVNYLETLFLPIFSRLATMGFQFHVLQFTWASANRFAQSRKACEEAGFSYEAVRIMRWPRSLGALMTAVLGTRRLHAAIREQAIDIIMPRSTLPGLMVLLRAKSVNCHVVFDADGLPLDERVEFTPQSSSGFAYRFQRDIEAEVVRRADAVIVRTNKAADILISRAGPNVNRKKFQIVSNGRDPESFKTLDRTLRAPLRERMNVGITSPLVVYVGSLGGKYCFAEMLQLFIIIHARRQDARLWVLTGSPKEAEDEIAKYVGLDAVTDVRTVTPSEVPTYLGCADLGLALIQQGFSMQAVSAVKLGEYFLCGVPVVATTGVGDSDLISKDVGFLVSEMNTSQIEAAASWFVDTVLPAREIYRLRCREFGLLNYSLDASVDAYARVLRSLRA